MADFGNLTSLTVASKHVILNISRQVDPEISSTKQTEQIVSHILSASGKLVKAYLDDNGRYARL